MALVGGVGLMAFGAFMLVVGAMIGRPGGDGSGEAFARTMTTSALAVGGVCVLAGLVAAVVGLVGMRRAERARAAASAAGATDADDEAGA